MYDTFKISEAIKKAAEAANQFKDSEDGGTCNFDSCFLRAPRMNKYKAESIERMSGVHCYLMDSKLYGRVLMIGIGTGQANRNTRMAEAAKNTLQGLGFNVGMWYQVD